MYGTLETEAYEPFSELPRVASKWITGSGLKPGSPGRSVESTFESSSRISLRSCKEDDGLLMAKEDRFQPCEIRKARARESCCYSKKSLAFGFKLVGEGGPHRL